MSAWVEDPNSPSGFTWDRDALPPGEQPATSRLPAPYPPIVELTWTRPPGFTTDDGSSYARIHPDDIDGGRDAA